jgi:parallel beta-helix repeat protein
VEVAGVRIENCVVDGSLTGIALDHVTAATIVNNTVTRADTTGIALADVAGSALFNNAVVNAGVGIAIARPGAALRIDHNLYIATATGRYGDEMSRVSLAPWRDVSGGLDAASVALPCEFRDAAKGDYTPVSKLDWNPGVPTTAGWGVATFGDAKAPATDMAGVARPASPGLGARGQGRGSSAAPGT